MQPQLFTLCIISWLCCSWKPAVSQKFPRTWEKPTGTDECSKTSSAITSHRYTPPVLFLLSLPKDYKAEFVDPYLSNASRPVSDVSKGPRKVTLVKNTNKKRLLTVQLIFINNIFLESAPEVQYKFPQLLRKIPPNVQGTFELASSPLTPYCHMFMKHTCTEFKKKSTLRNS